MKSKDGLALGCSLTVRRLRSLSENADGVNFASHGIFELTVLIGKKNKKILCYDETLNSDSLLTPFYLCFVVSPVTPLQSCIVGNVAAPGPPLHDG